MWGTSEGPRGLTWKWGPGPGHQQCYNVGLPSHEGETTFHQSGTFGTFKGISVYE
jgi:hypothetical protein